MYTKHRLIGLRNIFLCVAMLSLTGCGQASLGSKSQIVALTTPSPNQVLITKTDFTPKVLVVKKDTTVTWKNMDTASHLVASDPYPTHADLPGLVAPEAIIPGKEYQFTFTKVGEWFYHDDLGPITYNGVIKVIE